MGGYGGHLSSVTDMDPGNTPSGIADNQAFLATAIAGIYDPGGSGVTSRVWGSCGYVLLPVGTNVGWSCIDKSLIRLRFTIHQKDSQDTFLMEPLLDRRSRHEPIPNSNGGVLQVTFLKKKSYKINRGSINQKMKEVQKEISALPQDKLELKVREWNERLRKIPHIHHLQDHTLEFSVLYKNTEIQKYTCEYTKYAWTKKGVLVGKEVDKNRCAYLLMTGPTAQSEDRETAAKSPHMYVHAGRSPTDCDHDRELLAFCGQAKYNTEPKFYVLNQITIGVDLQEIMRMIKCQYAESHLRMNFWSDVTTETNSLSTLQPLVTRPKGEGGADHSGQKWSRRDLVGGYWPKSQQPRKDGRGMAVSTPKDQKKELERRQRKKERRKREHKREKSPVRHRVRELPAPTPVVLVEQKYDDDARAYDGYIQQILEMEPITYEEDEEDEDSVFYHFPDDSEDSGAEIDVWRVQENHQQEHHQQEDEEEEEEAWDYKTTPWMDPIQMEKIYSQMF